MNYNSILINFKFTINLLFKNIKITKTFSKTAHNLLNINNLDLISEK